jgi:hypothetical protein
VKNELAFEKFPNITLTTPQVQFSIISVHVNYNQVIAVDHSDPFARSGLDIRDFLVGGLIIFWENWEKSN